MKTWYWSLINGWLMRYTEGYCNFLWLRLSRDFAYRGIKISVDDITWHLQLSIPKTPTWTLIWWLRLDCDFRYRDFERLGNIVHLTLQSANWRSIPTCPTWRWTVLLSRFCEPSTPCTLKNVQVLLDPMMVGSYTWI